MKLLTLCRKWRRKTKKKTSTSTFFICLFCSGESGPKQPYTLWRRPAEGQRYVQEEVSCVTDSEKAALCGRVTGEILRLGCFAAGSLTRPRTSGSIEVVLRK